MPIIRTLTRTATNVAEPALRGLQTMLDPDAGSEQFTALDRRLETLESRLSELSDLDTRVATLVRAEVQSAVSQAVTPLGEDLAAVRSAIEEARGDLDHIRTQQAAAAAEAS